MFVLTRKEGEAVVLYNGDQEPIRVTVVLVKGNRVRLGFDAPDHCLIVRQELGPPDANDRAGTLGVDLPP